MSDSRPTSDMGARPAASASSDAGAGATAGLVDPEHLQPVADDGVGATTGGVVLWAVAGAACLVLRDQLEARGTGWWLWTCVAGFGLGLVGLAYVRRRARVYREFRKRQTGAEPGSSGPRAG